MAVSAGIAAPGLRTQVIAAEDDTLAAGRRRRAMA